MVKNKNQQYIIIGIIIIVGFLIFSGKIDLSTFFGAIISPGEAPTTVQSTLNLQYYAEGFSDQEAAKGYCDTEIQSQVVFRWEGPSSFMSSGTPNTLYYNNGSGLNYYTLFASPRSSGTFSICTTTPIRTLTDNYKFVFYQGNPTICNPSGNTMENYILTGSASSSPTGSAYEYTENIQLQTGKYYCKNSNTITRKECGSINGAETIIESCSLGCTNNDANIQTTNKEVSCNPPGGCKPGIKLCDNNIAYSCTINGLNIDKQECGIGTNFDIPICSQGTCICNNGDTRCSGDKGIEQCINGVYTQVDSCAGTSVCKENGLVASCTNTCTIGSTTCGTLSQAEHLLTCTAPTSIIAKVCALTGIYTSFSGAQNYLITQGALCNITSTDITTVTSSSYIDAYGHTCNYGSVGSAYGRYAYNCRGASNSQYSDSGLCPNGCDEGTGKCSFACTPGTSICISTSTKQTCNTAGTSYNTPVNCGSGTSCYGGQCSLCDSTDTQNVCRGDNPSTLGVDEDDVQRCSTTGTSYSIISDCNDKGCGYDANSNAVCKTCTPGEYRANGQKIERCNSQQTNWDLITTCAATTTPKIGTNSLTAYCDTTSSGCYDTKLGTKRCINSNSISQSCISTGDQSLPYKWGDDLNCGGNNLCDALGTGSCTQECAPGATRCHPNNPTIVQECLQDSTGYKDIQTCEISCVTGIAGASCGSCTEGERKCEGQQPIICRSGGTGYDPVGPVCPGGQFTCNNGFCPTACSPQGSTKCDTDQKTLITCTDIYSPQRTTCNVACIPLGDGIAECDTATIIITQNNFLLKSTINIPLKIVSGLTSGGISGTGITGRISKNGVLLQEKTVFTDNSGAATISFTSLTTGGDYDLELSANIGGNLTTINRIVTITEDVEIKSLTGLIAFTNNVESSGIKVQVQDINANLVDISGMLINATLNGKPLSATATKESLGVFIITPSSIEPGTLLLELTPSKSTGTLSKQTLSIQLNSPYIKTLSNVQDIKSLGTNTIIVKTSTPDNELVDVDSITTDITGPDAKVITKTLARSSKGTYQTEYAFSSPGTYTVLFSPIKTGYETKKASSNAIIESGVISTAAGTSIPVVGGLSTTTLAGIGIAIAGIIGYLIFRRKK